MVVIETAVLLAVAKGVAIGTASISAGVGAWWTQRKLMRCVSGPMESAGRAVVYEADRTHEEVFDNEQIHENERIGNDVCAAGVDDIARADISRETRGLLLTQHSHRFARRVALVARAKYGLLPRTEANRIMVRKYLHDYLVERDTRVSTMARMLDRAVEYAFIPTADDVGLARLRATEAVTQRVEDANAEYWSFRWWFLSPFGLRLGDRPEP